MKHRFFFLIFKSEVTSWKEFCEWNATTWLNITTQLWNANLIIAPSLEHCFVLLWSEALIFWYGKHTCQPLKTSCNSHRTCVHIKWYSWLAEFLIKLSFLLPIFKQLNSHKVQFMLKPCEIVFNLSWIQKEKIKIC